VSRLRGYLALLLVCLSVLLCDLVQRFVISPWVKLRPSSRIPVLGRWINAMAVVVTLPLRKVGGASIQFPARVVPCEPGTLILMNHQSVLDIPLVVKSVVDGYPRIVTRARYHRFIPLISHMVRLYQYPTVDPTANPRDVLKMARAMAHEAGNSDVPIAIFPEGTRTKDGSIGTFRKRGMEKVLKERAWTVYVFVVDGYWKNTHVKNFLADLSHLEGRVEHAATLEWADPTADSADFMQEVREVMIERLADMRSDAPAEA
jgi:1-acyl-sn-glycerol-3-phosphate acyltransferase